MRMTLFLSITRHLIGSIRAMWALDTMKLMMILCQPRLIQVVDDPCKLTDEKRWSPSPDHWICHVIIPQGREIAGVLNSLWKMKMVVKRRRRSHENNASHFWYVWLLKEGTQRRQNLETMNQCYAQWVARLLLFFPLLIFSGLFSFS